LLLVGVLAVAACSVAGEGVALARSATVPVLAGHHPTGAPSATAVVVARTRRGPRHLVKQAAVRAPVAMPPARPAAIALPATTRPDRDEGLRLDALVGERFPSRAPPGPVTAH
jgi:hypothetical protein